MNIYLKGYNGFLPEIFEMEFVSKIYNTKFILGSTVADKNSTYFPSRSDEKIMREDIKKSIISIRTMINDSFLTESELEKALLFVANGAFVENTQKHLNKILTTYKNLPETISKEDKVYQLYRISPPLLALETLTNSTMSFISQYTGIKGHNATIGNTSKSAFFAIEEAISALKNNSKTNAFVSASNCAGVYSFLCNSSIVGYKKGWRESVAGGNLLLSNLQSDHTICKITQINSSKTIPDIGAQEINRTWENLLPDSHSNLLIHSGAFEAETYELDQKYCEDFHKNAISLFPEYGNLGAADLIISLIHGVSKFDDTIRVIDIVDRDIFGRESHIRLEKC